jgi:hypothetical protein
LKNTNAAGAADLVFSYGPAGEIDKWIPIAGDWNADGIDTIGLYKNYSSDIFSSTSFYLKNTNAAGDADLVFHYGPARPQGSSWIPIAGDWNADGIDTIGLYNPFNERSEFFLRNSNTAGGADLTFSYGWGVPLIAEQRHWLPLAGDWDGL